MIMKYDVKMKQLIWFLAYFQCALAHVAQNSSIKHWLTKTFYCISIVASYHENLIFFEFSKASFTTRNEIFSMEVGVWALNLELKLGQAETPGKYPGVFAWTSFRVSTSMYKNDDEAFLLLLKLVSKSLDI